MAEPEVKVEEEQDLKKKNPEETTDDQSESETSVEEDPLKKDKEEGEESSEEGETKEESKESPEEVVEDMLKDGTSPNKKVTITKDKLDELSENSKLYKQFGPLLSKLKDNPEVAEKLMGDSKDEGETVEQRLDRLENENKEKARITLTNALTKAVSTWSDFRSFWPKVQPIMVTLEKQGIPTFQAMQQAYFAVNPEAAQKDERIVAQNEQNDQGRTSTGGGASKTVTPEVGELSEEDKEFARIAGIDPKLYKKYAKDMERFQGL